jgi:hypothetical protein
VLRAPRSLLCSLCTQPRQIRFTTGRAAGPISVSDLAAATGLADTTVSRALRSARYPDRDRRASRRVILYQLASNQITAQVTVAMTALRTA